MACPSAAILSTVDDKDENRNAIADRTDADAVIVRYTMMGDSNLDGVVDFADLVAVAQNYNQASVWTSGDFDYNGTTEFADLVAVAQHYNQSAAGRRSSRENPRVYPPGGLQQ